MKIMVKAKSKSKKSLETRKLNRSELKEKVYILYGIVYGDLKALKALKSEYASLDYRRTESWQILLESFVPVADPDPDPDPDFEEWCSSPPEEYREKFAEIAQANKEHQDNLLRAKKALKSLDKSFLELDKLAEGYQESAETLKEQAFMDISQERKKRRMSE